MDNKNKYVHRGRGAGNKTIVFGLIKRQGRVYTEIVPDCRKATLQAVIRGQIALDSIIYSDGWRGYDGLVDVGYGKHWRVEHGQDEFARGPVHVNGIESFWGYAKTRLARFRGPPSISTSKNVSSVSIIVLLTSTRFSSLCSENTPCARQDPLFIREFY